MPRLYKKRPVVIEAEQFKPDNANIEDVCAFLTAGGVKYHIKSAGILIRTLEGDMLAEPGDYIIRGIKSEYYPCKPDIFQGTYERL